MPLVKVWTGLAWAQSVPTTNLHNIVLSDDGTDQTSSLQTQLNAVPDGVNSADTQIIQLPTGSYRVDGTIGLSNRQNLIVEGPSDGSFAIFTTLNGHDIGAIDGNGDSTRAHIRLSGCSNVRLRHIKIQGPNTERDLDDARFARYRSSRAFEHGFSITNACDQVVLESVEIHEVYGDGIYIGGTGSPCTNITARDVIGRYTGRQQMGIVNVTNCLVEDANIQWGGRSGLDVEPNHDTHYVHDLTIRRVTMGSKSYPFVLGGDAGDSLIHIEDVLLEDCVGINAASSHTALLATRKGTNLTVRRHTDARQRSIQGLDIGGWTGSVLIEDSSISSGTSTPTSCGVYLNNVTAATTIRGCTFNGPSGAVGLGGADELYIVAGSVPSSIVHYGNLWNRSGSNDGSGP